MIILFSIPEICRMHSSAARKNFETVAAELHVRVAGFFAAKRGGGVPGYMQKLIAAMQTSVLLQRGKLFYVEPERKLSPVPFTLTGMACMTYMCSADTRNLKKERAAEP